MDPLAPPGHPAAPPSAATPHVALLRAGEGIIIPRCVRMLAALAALCCCMRAWVLMRAALRAHGSGWWHYAVAVTPSLTAQANFYSAAGASNTAGLVTLVMTKLQAARAGALAGARTGATSAAAGTP